MINTNSGNENILMPQHSLFDPNRFWGNVLLGIVGGVAGGGVMGIAARASMRAVALIGGQKPDFSLEGTLFVIGIGAVFGILISLVYAFILPFLPGSVSQKGAVWGALLALIITCLILFIEPDGELALIPKWALILLFGPLPLIHGFILGKIAARLIPDESNILIRLLAENLWERGATRLPNSKVNWNSGEEK